jgi:uncharacterized membrane protein
LYQGCTVTKTSHLPIRYFLALLWAHPILHISTIRIKGYFNTLNAELNPICHLLALLGAHHILHVRRIGVKGHFNPLNAELNPIWNLLALLGAHHIFHVSGLRVNGNFRYLSRVTPNSLMSCVRLTLKATWWRQWNPQVPQHCAALSYVC